jgi:hypothetical protein
MTLSKVLIVLMALSPFNHLMGFVIAPEGFISLCQQFFLALAANGVGDGKGFILDFLDPHESPTPTANDFQKHGSPPFSGHKKSAQDFSQALSLPVTFPCVRSGVIVRRVERIVPGTAAIAFDIRIPVQQPFQRSPVVLRKLLSKSPDHTDIHPVKVRHGFSPPFSLGFD